MLVAMRMWRSPRRTQWRMLGLFRAAVKKTGKIVQVGTQRRSTPSYQKAAEYIQSGKFGDIVMVEMTLERQSAGPLAASGRRASVEGAGHRLEAIPDESSL